MEQKRVSSDGVHRGRTVLLLVALLALVPVGAMVALSGAAEGEKPARKRPHERFEDRPRGDADEKADVVGGHPITRRKVRQVPSPAPQRDDALLRGEDQTSVAASPQPTDEDAARFSRFDQNAQAFDERLAAFDREKGEIDEETASALEERLLTALSSLHPEIRVATTCTASVCMVEVSSPDSVGTMIARISPWLRQHTSAATGDPVDDADDRSLRLAFDKSEVPVDL